MATKNSNTDADWKNHHMGRQSQDRTPQLKCSMAQPHDHPTLPNKFCTTCNQPQPTTMRKNHVTLSTNWISSSQILALLSPRIVHAPLQHFGLGLTDMHTEQGITHLLILLKHGYQTDDLTGQLIRRSMENMWLELGFSGSIFKLPYDELQHLATKSWIKTAWQFQQTHNICIEMDIPDLMLTRVNDTLIMLAFHAAGFRGNDLARPNWCCIYLQCTSLANLCDRSGNYLNPEMWASHPNTTFTSGYKWPNQTRPTKQDWIYWQIAIHSSFQFNFLHCLVHPLK